MYMYNDELCDQLVCILNVNPFNCVRYVKMIGLYLHITTVSVKNNLSHWHHILFYELE